MMKSRFNPYLNGYALEAGFWGYVIPQNSFNPYLNGYALEEVF